MVQWGAWRDVGMAVAALAALPRAARVPAGRASPPAATPREGRRDRLSRRPRREASSWVLDEHRLRGGDPVLPGDRVRRDGAGRPGSLRRRFGRRRDRDLQPGVHGPPGRPRGRTAPGRDGAAPRGRWLGGDLHPKRAGPRAGRRARGGPRTGAAGLVTGHDRRRRPRGPLHAPPAELRPRRAEPAAGAGAGASGPDGRWSAAWPSARRRRWRTSSCRRRSPGTSRRTAFTPASSTWPRASRSPSSRAGRPCTRHSRTAGCARHRACPAGSSATCAFAPGPAPESASSTRRSRTSRAGWWPRSKATW